MIDDIDRLRKTLEELLNDHDLVDEKVLKVSHELDDLIIEYYIDKNNLKSLSLEEI